MKAWRVHPGTEAPETVLGPRADGWTADGDTPGQDGVSACSSIEALKAYVGAFSLTPQPGDVILELVGRPVLDARVDPGECRILVSEIVAVHPISILDGVEGTVEG